MANRYALVIANYQFEDPKLSQLLAPGRDADLFSDVLASPEIGGFQVTRLINETLRVVRKEIAQLFHKRRKDDLLLIYYSGHGVKDDFGDLYLTVKDTELEFVRATAIDAGYIRDQIDKSNSRSNIVILDCCYSGAFSGRAKGALGSAVGTGDVLSGSGYGRVIMTASNAVEYAWEGEHVEGNAERSIFTEYLVDGLHSGNADLNHDGLITIDELYQYVYERVINTENHKQTPQKWAQKVEGQIFIAKSVVPERVKPVLPEDLIQATRSAFAGIREGAISELSQLYKSSDAEVAIEAERVLRALQHDQHPGVARVAAMALQIAPAPPPAPVIPVQDIPVPQKLPAVVRKIRVRPTPAASSDAAPESSVNLSGKLKSPQSPSVLALAGSKNFTLMISAEEKKVIFDRLKKERPGSSLIRHRIQVYATMIFVLLKNRVADVDQVRIDVEYTGYEAAIKEHLLNLLRRRNISASAKKITVSRLMPGDAAASLARKVLQGKQKPDGWMTAKDILDEF